MATIAASKKNTSARENNFTLKVDKQEVNLTNQNKIYFPKDKIAKGDVVDYYNRMYKFILPYLKDRPESLRRNPGGIEDEGFFQKDASDDTPEWVQTVPIYSESVNKEIN